MPFKPRRNIERTALSKPTTPEMTGPPCRNSRSSPVQCAPTHPASPHPTHTQPPTPSSSSQLKLTPQAASKTGCALAVLIGHEEVRKGVVAVKTMATGAQTLVPAGQASGPELVKGLELALAQAGFLQ